MQTNVPPTNISKWSVIKRKVKKITLVLAVLIIVSVGLVIYWKYYYTYSEGYRAGLLQKFSHKGNFFKTYEGELILNGVSSNTNDTLASEKFYFSVTRRKLAHQLDTMQGRMVVVHFRQKNGKMSWHGDSEYIVDSIRRIPQNSQQYSREDE